MRPRFLSGRLALAIGVATPVPTATAQSTDAARLVAALLGDTAMLADAQALTDRIGGRATGSAANVAGVDWAVARFRHRHNVSAGPANTKPMAVMERDAAARAVRLLRLGSACGSRSRWTSRPAAPTRVGT